MRSPEPPHYDPATDTWLPTPSPGSPEARAIAEDHQRQADALQLADSLRHRTVNSVPSPVGSYTPPQTGDDSIRGVYVPKHIRIYAEILRTAAALIAAGVNVSVLVILLTR